MLKRCGAIYIHQLFEGKFHEVHSIFRALGNEVTELERIAIGGLTLPQDLKPGQWRNMTDEEKARLSGLTRESVLN